MYRSFEVALLGAYQFDIGVPRPPSVEGMVEYRKDIPAPSVQAVVHSCSPQVAATIVMRSRHRSPAKAQTELEMISPASSSALVEYTRTLGVLEPLFLETVDKGPIPARQHRRKPRQKIARTWL